LILVQRRRSFMKCGRPSSSLVLGLALLSAISVGAAGARGTDVWIVVDLLKMEISVHKGGVAQ
jgi:hypothetical protein